MLIELEPVIKQAGTLALKLRPNAKIQNKLQTGIHGIDIVTNADFGVQEAILLEMAKTKLIECQLIAEEDTPSVNKFRGTNGLTLTLDPIDGTFGYAGDSDFFSIIVGLRDNKSLLYTLCHYPAVNWTRRIARNEVVDFGELPYVKTIPNLDLTRTIAHTIGNPKKAAREIYRQLTSDGYIFRPVTEITDQSGACTLLFLNQVAGYYTENPNSYDGLSALYYGQVKGWRIFSTVDITKITNGRYGPYHQGWYVVLLK